MARNTIFVDVEYHYDSDWKSVGVSVDRKIKDVRMDKGLSSEIDGVALR